MDKLIFHKLLSIRTSIFLCLVLHAQMADAYDVIVDGIYYNLNTNSLTAQVTYNKGNGTDYSGSITIPNSIIVNNKEYAVNGIGNSAFMGCRGLTSVSLPNSIITIDMHSFEKCSGLTSIVIHDGVKYILESAFEGCSRLTSITIPNSVVYITSKAFKDCSGITSFTIPNGISSIFSFVFEGCSGLTSITIPNSVNSIGVDAFYGCSGLTSVTIPNSVTSISFGAFLGCSSLTSITIPNSVSSIDEYAFASCSSLTNVISNIEEPFEIPTTSFGGISNKAILHVPQGTKNSYLLFPGWANHFKDIVESGVTQYSLSISVSGNGSVTYNGTSIRNSTSSFTVDEGASAILTFTPDNGYRLASVKVGSTSVLSNVKNNQYTINNITANVSVAVEFAESPKEVAFEGVNYTVASNQEKTVTVAKGNYGQVLTVPATFSSEGATWTVTGVDVNALSENKDIAAIIWEPKVPFTETVSNPNLLLYVTSAEYAPSSIKNVVVNGTAASISLIDAAEGNDFYCPEEFTAQRISYAHRYDMITGLQESGGWETIALPFDVDRVEHGTKGTIIPFLNWQNGNSQKPFWLYEYGSGGFREASAIRANTPYIISMPNNEQYLSDYRLNGTVTFSASNATVRKSDDMQSSTNGTITFVPNFMRRESNDGCYALNVKNDYVTNSTVAADGSMFVRNSRAVLPFEAYMTTQAANAREFIPVFEDVPTGIKDVPLLGDSVQGNDSWYTLEGLKLSGKPEKKGVYIYNGKVVVR